MLFTRYSYDKLDPDHGALLMFFQEDSFVTYPHCHLVAKQALAPPHPNDRCNQVLASRQSDICTRWYHLFSFSCICFPFKFRKNN